MKVTFVTPPAIDSKAPERLFGCNYGYFFQPNIFMLYSASVLEKEGHKVKVIDCPVEGIGVEKFMEFLKKDDSDAYVIYSVFLAEKTDTYWARYMGEFNPKVNIIFIGPEPSARPEAYLKPQLINYPTQVFVIRGEPEGTIKELFQWFQLYQPHGYHLESQKLRNCKGLSWIDRGPLLNQAKVTHNPPRPIIENLDIVPYPNRKLIHKELYYNPKLRGRPSTVMMTSRGCFGQCIYCIPCSYCFAREIDFKRFNDFRKPPVRNNSPKYVIEEFRLLKRQGYKAVAIIDDNFINDKKRVIEICRGIKDLRMEWGCLARADMIDDEVAQAMADAGCVYVDVGVESFDQKILNYVRKGITIGQIFTGILTLKKHGIEPKINILLGTSPLETEKNIKWNVEILKMLNIDWVSFDVVIPHPWTEFYKIVKQGKWFDTKSGDFEGVDPMKRATVSFPKGLSSTELQELVRWSYRAFYFRPQYVWKRIVKVRSFRELGELVSTVRRLWE